MGYKAKGRVVHYVKSGFEVEEFLKCRKNPFYFINTYVKITSQRHGAVNFVPYAFQASILMGWLRYKETCMLKPRQMGISTLLAAYFLWMFIFYTDKELLIISIRQDTARALMRRIKFMYINLPDFLKVEIVNGTPSQVGTSDMMVGSNGCILEVTGSTDNAGRSGSYFAVAMDEAAFQRHASTTFGAAAPAALNNGGQVIILSTAFGMENFFYQTYSGALANTNGFHPMRLKWQMHPDYTDEWHARQYKLLGKMRTAQEIDCNFLQSGYNVFDMAKIRAIEDRMMGDDAIEPLVSHNGNLLEYFKPVPGIQYTLGADVATGRGRDSSAFSIYDPKGKEVACYNGKIGVRDYANLMMKVGAKYNYAILAPEINSIGEGVIATIQAEGYPNVYHTVSDVLRLDEFEKNEKMIEGWITTGKSRHEIISGMDDDLSDDLVEIWNPFFVRESYTFIYNSANRAAAAGKTGGAGRNATMYEEESETMTNTDDSILASCITNAVRKNHAKFRGAMPIWVP